MGAATRLIRFAIVSDLGTWQTTSTTNGDLLYGPLQSELGRR